MSLDLNNINVLNYNENSVFVDSSNGQHFKFSGSRDGKRPSVNVMSINEIKSIYNNSDIFQNGWLTFEEDEKEEVFKELRMTEWQDILSNNDIRDILLNPTADGLQKIIDIKSVPYFDRVRTQLFKLIHEDAPVVAKVKELVNARHKELQRRKRNSELVVKEKDIPMTDEKAKKLEEQNANLQAQLDEMKLLMQQLVNANNATTVHEKTEDSVAAIEKTTTTKKVGRPKKS